MFGVDSFLFQAILNLIVTSFDEKTQLSLNNGYENEDARRNFEPLSLKSKSISSTFPKYLQTCSEEALHIIWNS